MKRLYLLLLIIFIFVVPQFGRAIELPTSIKTQLEKRYPNFRLIVETDYTVKFAKIFTATPGLQALDFDSNSKIDYVLSFIDSSNTHFIFLAMANKSGPYTLTELSKSKRDSKICTNAVIKQKGDPGISARKYFYYNFESHPGYKKQSKPFWDFVETQKNRYMKKLSIEVNIPMVPCSKGAEDDFAYSSNAFYYEDHKIAKYYVYD